MWDDPRTRYARSDDGVHLAYQVVGAGWRDLLDAHHRTVRRELDRHRG